MSSEGEGDEAAGAGSLAGAHALQGSDPTWHPVLAEVRGDVESEELMELGAEDAGTFESAASSYRDTTHPLLSDEEHEDEGAYFGSGSEFVTPRTISLDALKGALEGVATSESRDDAQAQGAAQTSDSAGISSSAPTDAQAG